MPDVFRSFEIDKAARAAVFSRDQGQFCAGADLNTVCGRWKKEAATGAVRFAKGAGRHGRF
jgi:enoyl-CoA hydratase/carnithine racemase